jgi:hypothetical protein
MRKIIMIIICVLIITATFTHARVGSEYIRWANGDFKIPNEIQEANTVAELQPFLNGKDEFKKMAAVRRLGEIEGKKAVNLLYEIFTAQPPTRGVDSAPLVRLEIIRTLGRVDGNEAKTALLDILERFWKAGPQVPEAKKQQYWYDDIDFADIVPESLKQLYKQNSDEKVYETVKKIALSEDIKKYDSSIRTASWKVYLKGEMAKKHLAERESVMYLLRYHNDLEKQGDKDTMKGSKMAAARDIMADCNETVLTGMAEEFENVYKTAVKKNDPNASNILSDTRHIRNILEEKKAKKEKQQPDPNVRVL